MKVHGLKILPEYYNDILKGNKKFEVRKNDRDFKVNDTLLLREFENGTYTGRELVKTIIYILNDSEYCKEGYVVLGLQDDNQIAMYENCIADLVGELQKYSTSCYFRSTTENELINYFKNKWGINKDICSEEVD